MTEKLFLEDSYLKEFEAEVVNVNDKYIILDRTCFYPKILHQFYYLFIFTFIKNKEFLDFVI